MFALVRISHLGFFLRFSYESRISDSSCVSGTIPASFIGPLCACASCTAWVVTLSRAPDYLSIDSAWAAASSRLACVPLRCFALSLLNRYAQSQARIVHRGSLLESLSSVFFATSGSPPCLSLPWLYRHYSVSHPFSVASRFSCLTFRCVGFATVPPSPDVTGRAKYTISVICDEGHSTVE